MIDPLDASGRSHRRLPAPRATAPFDVVLLDRDGTLNRLAPGYRTPRDFTMLPGAAAAVARLCAAGCRIAIVTNQRGLATGGLSWADLMAVNRQLVAAVRHAGGEIDDIRLCPHDTGTCTCRKPLPGLLDEFFTDNPHLSRRRSVMVGDSDGDAGAAASAGVPFMRVESSIGLAGVVDSLLPPEPGRIS